MSAAAHSALGPCFRGLEPSPARAGSKFDSVTTHNNVATYDSVEETRPGLVASGAALQVVRLDGAFSVGGHARRLVGELEHPFA
jgi:hypothetical protein